jgi:hypothetical protein
MQPPQGHISDIFRCRQVNLKNLKRTSYFQGYTFPKGEVFAGSTPFKQVLTMMYYSRDYSVSGLVHRLVS